MSADPGSDPSATPSVPRPVHPVLRYTTLRIALFVVVLAVTYAVGLRALLLLVVALVVSGGLSLVLLRSQRDAVATVVDQRRARPRAEPGPDDD